MIFRRTISRDVVVGHVSSACDDGRHAGRLNLLVRRSVDLRMGGRDIASDQLVPNGNHFHGKGLVVGERAANVPVGQRQQPFRELLRKRRIEEARAIAERHPHVGCQMRDRPLRSLAPWLLPDAARAAEQAIHVL